MFLFTNPSWFLRENQMREERMDEEPKGWLEEDESAKEMMGRLLLQRPSFLVPPLHRVPLRVGNIVEIVGPSHSAKTHILIQAAITCILPREWKGVEYGGLGHLVMFIDLDCRFDVFRFSEMLIHRINEPANRRGTGVSRERSEDVALNDRRKGYDEELFALCMRRLLYARCYDSFEFLATLKTLHYKLRKEKDVHGIGVHLLAIDSIGAFYWMDRGSSSFPLEGNQRKILSGQSVSETVVQELRKLLMVHPLLVMATKASIFGDRCIVCEPGTILQCIASQLTCDSLINFKNTTTKMQNISSDNQQFHHREYMSSIWQSFVTHRMLVQADASVTNSEHEEATFYLAKWLLPPLTHTDKFTVTDAGLHMVS